MKARTRNRSVARASPEASRSDDPAASANACFHDTYDAARSVAVRAGPILVVAGDDLVLVRGAMRSVITVTPRLFHLAKSVAHAPVALLACSYRAVSGVFDDVARGRLTRLASSLRDLERDLPVALAEESEMLSNLRRILGLTDAHLTQALTDTRVDPAALAAFAKTVGPALLESTRHATSLQLAALHAEATKLLAPLDAVERRTLEVVVTGEHQARARNLPMQYFAKLLSERPGEERRVAYAEGATTVDEALTLVGTRRLDRQIALALFGSSDRLQRDVLGDAATEQVARREILPLR